MDSALCLSTHVQLLKELIIITTSVTRAYCSSLLMSSRATPKRPRDIEAPEVAREYERLPNPKRSRPLHRHSIRPVSQHTPDTSSAARGNTRSAASSVSQSEPLEKPPSQYLFTFTSALKHVLNEVQSPPTFMASTEAYDPPLHTVDEDIADVLLNKPCAGKVCL